MHLKYIPKKITYRSGNICVRFKKNSFIIFCFTTFLNIIFLNCCNLKFDAFVLLFFLFNLCVIYFILFIIFRLDLFFSSVMVLFRYMQADYSLNSKKREEKKMFIFFWTHIYIHIFFCIANNWKRKSKQKKKINKPKIIKKKKSKFLINS